LKTLKPPESVEEWETESKQANWVLNWFCC